MTRMRDRGPLLEQLDKLAELGLEDCEKAAAMLREAEKGWKCEKRGADGWDCSYAIEAGLTPAGGICASCAWSIRLEEDR
jgi:hypothetical protein